MPGKVERDVHAQKLIMIAREVAGCGGKGIVQLSDAPGQVAGTPVELGDRGALGGDCMGVG